MVGVLILINCVSAKCGEGILFWVLKLNFYLMCVGGLCHFISTEGLCGGCVILATPF